MSDVTKEEVRQALLVAAATASAIREAGRIPSGHLYAILCGRMTLDTYYHLLTLLEEQKLVRVENHEVIWTGPPAECHA